MTLEMNQHEKLSPMGMKVNNLIRQHLPLSKGFELGNVGERTHSDKALGTRGVMAES